MGRDGVFAEMAAAMNVLGERDASRQNLANNAFASTVDTITKMNEQIKELRKDHLRGLEMLRDAVQAGQKLEKRVEDLERKLERVRSRDTRAT